MSALSRLDLHHASLLLTALTLVLSLTAGCAVPPAGANDFPCRTKSTLVVDTSGRLPRAVLTELPGDLFSPDTPFFKESLEVRPLSALRPGALPVAQPTVSPSESAQLFTHGLCLTLHRAPACDAEAGLALAIPARRKSDAAAL